MVYLLKQNCLQKTTVNDHTHRIPKAMYFKANFKKFKLSENARTNFLSFFYSSPTNIPVSKWVLFLLVKMDQYFS